MNELLDILIDRDKNIMDELKNHNINKKQIESALQKNFFPKLRKKKKNFYYKL